MSTDFFKFPNTPHLGSFGTQIPRDDKLLPPAEVTRFLSSEIIVEEKIDGANLGISLGNNGELRAQNRGNYIPREAGGQFKQLWRWIDIRKDTLAENLGGNLILFGEWCYAEHSVSYHKLPDWFIGFDIFDRGQCKFYSIERRNALLETMEIEIVATLARGVFKMNDLKKLLEGHSQYGASHLEGVYVRKDEGDWLQSRAKLVRPEFTQSITEHWSSQHLKVNRVIFE